MRVTKATYLLAALAALGVGRAASASFIYASTLAVQNASVPTGDTVTTTANSVTFTSSTGSTIVTFANQTRGGYTVPGIDSVDLGDYTVTSTEPATSSGDSATITLTDSILLTNVPTPGTAGSGALPNFPLTMTLTGVSAGSGMVAVAFTGISTGSETVGGVNFAVGSTAASMPTINGNGGSISAVIGATTAVPEPTALAGLALGGLTLRRRRRA